MLQLNFVHFNNPVEKKTCLMIKLDPELIK